MLVARSSSVVRLLTLAFALPAAAAAQPLTLVPDEPACSSCTIEVEDVVRLDAAGLIPVAPQEVVLDGSGRYWLVFVNDLAMIYEADGRFIKSLSEGGGPQEFEYPASITAVGDSLLVYDHQRGWAVVGPDLTVARRLARSRMFSRPIPFAWPDSVLLSVPASSSGTERRSVFNVASFAGEEIRPLRSFTGADPPAPIHPMQGTFISRSLMPGRAGVWITDYTRYRIDDTAFDGEVRQVYLREAPWFEEPNQRMRRSSQPPQPRIRAVREDAGGLLWVYISVAAPTWREGYPVLEGTGPRDVRESEYSYEKLYQTTVEVIDPAAGRVLARRTIPNYIVSPVGDDRAAIYDTTEIGEPLVRIVRLRLAR
ncbi:MAG: hypothetical protein WEB88_07615 [Gemmatimonadota bacterium]